MSNKFEISSEYIKSHKLHGEFDAFHLFTHLVMNANDGDDKVAGFSQKVTVKKGQYWVGSKLLLITKATGLSDDHVMLLLGYLAGVGVITFEYENIEGYLITVNDYEEFTNAYTERLR